MQTEILGINDNYICNLPSNDSGKKQKGVGERANDKANGAKDKQMVNQNKKYMFLVWLSVLKFFEF